MRRFVSAADTPPPSAANDGEAPPESSFLVVGIGASAGGLEAVVSLIASLSVDGMAFVVVQHLAPDHVSLLPAILGRSSRLPVAAIADGMRVEPNRVHVAPPNASVGLLNDVFHLLSPSSPLPIDAFFRTLAEDKGPRAIGVVLSGMGSDGTQGLREIKARGGLAFAQDRESAKYDSMPASAQESGVVDRVLTPQGIAAELMAISKHPYMARSPQQAPVLGDRDELGKLFVMIRSAYGNDLSLYKQSTVNRRVERRMALQQISKLTDYIRHVQEHREELAALYQDILIGVTSFFRDVEPFEMLQRVILPQVLERKAPSASIRVWVPACSTGEEAYSIAIVLLELLERSMHRHRIQIFATDVDEDAIAHARRGMFPRGIETDVSKERLERFFLRTGEGYQVGRQLRELLVFSLQNLTTDAPFSRMDFVSCRNLLIYLQPPLQKKVLRLLHYALVSDGILLIGNSETVGDSAALFSLLDRKNKIYVKRNLPASDMLDVRGALELATTESYSAGGHERGARATAQQIADRKLVERYGPPSVLVNENLDVLQFRGDTGRYLSPAPGAAALNLLKLLRPELHVEVWRAIQGALETNAPTQTPPLMLMRDGEDGRAVAIEVFPIHEPDTKSRCLLVVFEDRPSQSEPAPVEGTEGADARLRNLEKELAATKEYLQSTIEELETSNEELKSTNEELQSANEELQSTNEELETSKEELQSANEELLTMNDELEHRMRDLRRASSDLDNLLLSVHEPVLFFDSRRLLNRASDGAQNLLRLNKESVGRPLAELKASFAGADIEEAVRTTTERLVETSRQARIQGRWYEIRVRPYRSAGGIVDGAVVVLRDIDVEKRREELVLDVETYAAKVLTALPQPLAIIDRQLRVLWVNEPFLATFRVDAHATVGNLLQNLGSGQWAHPKLREVIEAALAHGHPFHEFRIEHEFEAIGHRVMRVSGSVVTGIAGPDRVVLLTIIPDDRQAAVLP